MSNDGLRRRHSAPHFDEDGDSYTPRHSPPEALTSSPPTSNATRPRSLAAFVSPNGTAKSGRSHSSGSERRVRFSADHDRISPNRQSSSPSRASFRPPVNNRTQGFSQRPGTPRLTIDVTKAKSSSATEIASAPTRSPMSPSSPQITTQTAPSSPRTARDRGYSLRKTIFKKNVNDQRVGRQNSVIELSEPGPFQRPGTSDSLQSTRAPGKKSVDSIVTAVPAGNGEKDTSNSATLKFEAARQGSVLPNYENWMQQKALRRPVIRSLRHRYHQARKFVLRITDIPPSKDGRHIEVDAHRNDPVIDERTSKSYIPNNVRSSRYNIYNFVPRQLWAQFSKLANAYFLFVSILQMIPGLSTTGTYTTIVPLLFFVTISIAKEGYDDFRRYKLDKEENNRGAQVLRPCRLDGPPPDSTEDASESWITIKWHHVKVGDLIRLHRDEYVPADMILLQTHGSSAYIETMALDGETNLKSKTPNPSLASVFDTHNKLVTGSAHLVVEDPNLDLYEFSGRAIVGDETVPLSNGDVVYRGSVLRNTSHAVGIVCYTGEECKIRMNASKNPRIKAPSLQSMVNKIVVAMVVFVLALSIGCTVSYQIWQANVEEKAWYLARAGVDFFPILVSFIIMFNTLIPLSLYVSLEIVKVCQRFLLNDIDMYDEDSDTPMEARTSTINEELGQVSYIFSDKTGTLTENSMKFRKISVAGNSFLHDSDLKMDAVKEAEKMRARQHKSKGKMRAGVKPQRSFQGSSGLHPPRKSTSALPRTGAVSLDQPSPGASGNELASPGWTSSAQPMKAQGELHTIEMVRYIQRRPFTVFAKKARFFLLSLALCHTCLPEKRDDGTIAYQAASPDELALVQAAQELGYTLNDRSSSTVTIKTYPHGFDAEPQLDQYEVLDVIEFSSKRKRMSVIVRMPDGQLCCFSKGADSVIMNRLRLSALASEKSADIARRASVRKSVEAQQAMARKRSEQMEPGSPPGRPSISGFGRASVNTSQSATRWQLDDWLTEREKSNDAPVVCSPAAYSRPSNLHPRPSAAGSSARSSFQTDDLQFDLVDEALVVDEPAVIERCLQDVDDFAREGLRTLLYAYRFISEEEYKTWQKIYHEASTSLVSRQEEMERAGEQIEHTFELAGATAIEDKLQKGVPESIDKLRRAGIKLWMLTGDKRETAMNIGTSCRLIHDYSAVTVLDSTDPFLEQLLASTIVATSSGSVAHSVVVVDGATLSFIDVSPTLKSLFTDLGSLVDSLICCRASPAQKASLVRSIRRKERKSVTLAIGDGANDIAMIQEAHVGIGITGKEGLQAARTSDYSIAQFRFLTKLLLVHGRWNYIRTAKYTAATFWKEMMFYLTQALFQRWAGYTGTSFYESWSLTTFNTLFTSLPVIILGVFEKDIRASTALAVPELYSSMGLKNAMFNFRVYAWWIFLAASESMLVYFVMFALYGSDDGFGLARRLASHQTLNSTIKNSNFFASVSTTSGGSDNIYPMGSLTFTAVIIIISTKLQFLEMHNISISNVLSWIISVGGWFLWNFVLDEVYSDNTIYKVKGAFFNGYGNDLAWWATLAVILVAVAVLELSWRSLRWVIGDHHWTLASVIGFEIKFALPGPTDAEIFQSLERDPVMRRRFEDAARADMPYSLPPSEDVADEVMTDEKKTQAQREQEIEELMRRRGLHDTSKNGANDERRRSEKMASGRSQSWAV